MISAQRLGQAPKNRSIVNKSQEGQCPDILLIDNPGQLNIKGTDGMRTRPVYGVVGTLANSSQLAELNMPSDVTLAPYEAMVFIPEEVFIAAAKDYLSIADTSRSKENAL